MPADRYFSWLVEFICPPDSQFSAQPYQKLLWKLFVTDYVYELKLDKNRAADGLYLRRYFGQEMGIMGFDLVDFRGVSRGCNMLEMLVALAKDTEDHLMYDPDYGDRTSVWFWIFLKNLGLDVYDDCHWFESNVDDILRRFLGHQYAPDGSGGGLFVVKNGRFDMRKIDLWLQLNMWFQENFPVGNW